MWNGANDPQEYGEDHDGPADGEMADHPWLPTLPEAVTGVCSRCERPRFQHPTAEAWERGARRP